MISAIHVIDLFESPYFLVESGEFNDLVYLLEQSRCYDQCYHYLKIFRSRALKIDVPLLNVEF